MPGDRVSHPLDRCDALPVALNCEGHTRENSLSVHKDGAANTGAVVA